jgi:hypothetical protein
MNEQRIREIVREEIAASEARKEIQDKESRLRSQLILNENRRKQIMMAIESGVNPDEYQRELDALLSLDHKLESLLHKLQ